MCQLHASIQLASTLPNLPTAQQFRRWMRAALRVDTEVTVRLIDEAEGRLLNHTYRGKDHATNVLTFALTETPHLMGDIVICAPVVLLEAAQQGKLAEAHFAHMTVHGILHLHGYDHENEAQAILMESIEVFVLEKLGYANPYRITEENA